MHFEKEDKVQLDTLKEDIQTVCESLGPVGVYCLFFHRRVLCFRLAI
jgi:hypothetical protein